MKKTKAIAIISILLMSITHLSANGWYSSDKNENIQSKYKYKNQKEQKGHEAIKGAVDLVNKNRLERKKTELVKKSENKNMLSQASEIKQSSAPTMESLVASQEEENKSSMIFIKDFTNIVMGLNRYKRRGGFPYSNEANDDKWNKRNYISKEVAQKWKYQTKTKGKFIGMIRRVLGYVVIEPKMENYPGLAKKDIYEALKQKCLNGEGKVKGAQTEQLSETNLKCVIENNVSIYKWF